MESQRCDAASDLEVERDHLARAYAAAEADRERVRAALEREESGESGAQEVDSQILSSHLAVRLRSRSIPDPLCFGRIDTEGGESHHIGRLHVADAHGDPLVVDWRAPVARPFYTATPLEPEGLTRRRRFVTEGRHLIDVINDDLTSSDPDSVSGGLPDPLLYEMDRGRDGRMRDVVATVQREQDLVIRSPLEKLLVVQGGPGTGKTVVGLHRAAYLLFRHRGELQGDSVLSRKAGVLIVGPTSAFLRYISEVLPSLGESATTSSTVSGLVGWVAARSEIPDVHRIKGDLRMARVVRNACEAVIRVPDHDMSFSVGRRTVTLAEAEVVLLIQEALAERRSLRGARALFRHRWMELVGRQLPKSRSFAVDEAMRRRELGTQGDAARALNRAWPATSPDKIVTRLFTSPSHFRSMAAGIFDEVDIETMVGEMANTSVRTYTWSEADIAVLDEAAFVLAGAPEPFEYAIVDEAQSLSAMELRAISRRIPSGRMTLLGDLAQGVGPSAQTSWAALIDALDVSTPFEVAELTVGYRTPAPVLDVANSLLSFAAPTVTPTQAVRPGEPPAVVTVSDSEMVAATVADLVAKTPEATSVAVIAQTPQHAELAAAFDERHLRFHRVKEQGVGEGLNLLDPTTSRGLEFDSVVVVEPASIAGDDAVGHRRLFVALTRAVHSVTLVSSRPLPPAVDSAIRSYRLAG